MSRNNKKPKEHMKKQPEIIDPGEKRVRIKRSFSLIPQLYIRPYSAGKELVENKKQALPAAFTVFFLRSLTVGVFFLCLIAKIDRIIRVFIMKVNEVTGSTAQAFFDWCSRASQKMLVLVRNESAHQTAEDFFRGQIDAASNTISEKINWFFQNLTVAMRFPLARTFLIAFVVASIACLVTVFYVFIFNLMTKHPNRSFSHAISFAASGNMIGTLFDLFAAGLVFVRPVLGFGMYAIGFLWRMSYLQAAMYAGSSDRSANRTAVLFPLLYIVFHFMADFSSFFIAIVPAIIVFHQVSLFFQGLFS